MFKIANAQLWVQDQEEALAFYTEKVGMEIAADVTLPELGTSAGWQSHPLASRMCRSC